MERAETVVNRELANIRASLDRLGRLFSSAEPVFEMFDKIRKMPGLPAVREKAVANGGAALATATPTKRKTVVTTKMLMWGKTLGLIRALPLVQRGRVGAVMKAEGVRAAYRLARQLRQQQDGGGQPPRRKLPKEPKGMPVSERRKWASRYAGLLGAKGISKEEKAEAARLGKSQGYKAAVGYLERLKTSPPAAKSALKTKEQVSLSRAYVAHRKSASLTQEEKDQAEEIFNSKGPGEAVAFLEKVKKEKRGESQASSKS